MGVMSGVYKGETLEGRLMAKSDVVLAVGLDRMELLTPWKYEQPTAKNSARLFTFTRSLDFHRNYRWTGTYIFPAKYIPTGDKN